MTTTEQRKEARRAVSGAGWITIEGSAIRHDCTVSDISPAGARIALPRARRLPDHFYLEVGYEVGRRLCRTVWRQGRQVGIAFQSQD